MRAFPRGRRAVDRDPRRAIAIGASSQPTRIAATVAPVWVVRRAASSPSASLGAPIAGRGFGRIR
jgi:hypothetical protein